MTGRPVVVMGSGAAGLSAALGAAAGGAEVVVLERETTLGGTTALSGGVVWLPASAAMRAVGLADDAGAARCYLEALATGEVDHDLIAAFCADAGRVASEIEKRTPLVWEVLEQWPDYRGEIPGARAGGRSLWPRTLRLPAAIERRIRPAPDQPSPSPPTDPAHADPVATGPVNAGPVNAGPVNAGPVNAGPVNDGPVNDGVVFRGPVRGRALVGALLAGLAEAGVEVRTGAAVSDLVFDGGVVTGVRMGDELVEGSVVLASGGFQHDAGLVATHLAGVPLVAMGSRGCAGDGLRLALAAGAVVGNMDEGWWMPALAVPGEELDGAVYYRPLHAERAQPGAIMVEGTGRRFVNEAQNYGDVGRAMARVAGPVWLIFDAAYRRRYGVGPLGPGDPDPSWLARAPDIETLARLLGLPSGRLADTMTTFNQAARRGADPAFGRGSLPYDLWIGDASAAHPTLAPVDEAPFYAVPVHLGCMGTKGGPRTDDRGRVLGAEGSVLPGLYAAGNVAANPFGRATPAGGGTLGPALVFGFRAGEAAAADR